MADFTIAFQQGLEAAEAAKIARQEIDDVLSELDRQVRQVSEGKICVCLKQFDVPDKRQGALDGIGALAALGAFQNPFVIREKEKYWAIVAQSLLIPGRLEFELATWSQGRSGYPCKITYASINRTCSDRESLEIALSDLLSDPGVGDKLSRLLRVEQSLAVE